MECVDDRARRLLQEYHAALEEERRKILVFQRELPLSFHLVNQAIESIAQQIGCSGVSSGGPVLEEFIPLKPIVRSSSLRENETRRRSEESEEDNKPDWLRSVHLWNQSSETTADEVFPTKPIPVDARKICGGFCPLDNTNAISGATEVDKKPILTSVESNSKGGGHENPKEELDKEGNSQNHRKTRRSWSPELHSRFLRALQQLGSPHAATPKQIRELMKVDGLTNDEVKSHLQKYRLHSRRPAPAVQTSTSTNQMAQQTQFVLLSGFTIQHAEYAAASPVVASETHLTNTPTGIGIARKHLHAPIASVPTKARPMVKKNKESLPNGPLRSEKGSRVEDIGRDDENTNLGSSCTSSSSQTTAV